MSGPKVAIEQKLLQRTALGAKFNWLWNNSVLDLRLLLNVNHVRLNTYTIVGNDDETDEREHDDAPDCGRVVQMILM